MMNPPPRGIDHRIWHDDEARAIATSRDWLALIEFCCGSNHYDYTRVWALAMTAHFGPTGLHESRRGVGGRPDPEKCADCPRVFETMREAEEAILRTFGLAVST